MSKLSQQYYDNILAGNTEEAGTIKAEMDEQVKTAQRTSSTHPTFINTLLNDDHTPAIHVYDFLNEKYKDKWWDWEIETLEHEIWGDFGLVLSDGMADKVQAIKLLINNHRPFLDWWYFNQLASAFCGTIADFTSIKSPSPGMAIATVKAMHEIRPEENFSRDVKKYICMILINDGIYTPPVSISDILIEEFENLVSKEIRDIWPAILKRTYEMLNDKSYSDSDDTVDIQARRLLIAEQAANKFGG
jgi:hypothetical protein